MRQKYASYSETGIIIGYYDSIDSPVPSHITKFIPISEMQWKECLSTPYYTVINGVLTAPTEQKILDQTKAMKIAALKEAYRLATISPVHFKTAAGNTALFATTPDAIGYLQGVIDAGSAAWTANLWLSNDGTPVTPFTFADVQGLAAAIEAVDTPEYYDLLKLISEVTAATTVSAVQAISWK